MKTLKNWKLQNQSAHHIELLVDGQAFSLPVYTRRKYVPGSIKTEGGFVAGPTWSIAPEKDVPLGRASSRRY